MVRSSSGVRAYCVTKIDGLSPGLSQTTTTSYGPVTVMSNAVAVGVSDCQSAVASSRNAISAGGAQVVTVTTTPEGPGGSRGSASLQPTAAVAISRAARTGRAMRRS